MFPHHECEAAQSEAVTGRPLARHWMHAGMVGLDGEKMSKSLGNLVFVEDLLDKCEPAVARLALLSHHYREDWEWRDDRDRRSGRPARVLAGAGLAMAGASIAKSPAPRCVRGHLDDDLDTPSALALMDEAATAAGREAAQLLPRQSFSVCHSRREERGLGPGRHDSRDGMKW